MISWWHSSNGGLGYIRYVTPIFFILHIVYGYNMDVRSPIVRTGPAETYFGFSVDIHREGNDDMLLVGAPRGDSNVPGATRTGAVYKCNLEPPYTSQTDCELLTVDTGVESERNKSEQWLGATVKSSGPDGVVMSCAPFYKVLRFSHTEISGKCFLQRNNFADTDPKVLCAPQHQSKVGFQAGTSCLAGLSGDLTEDGRFVIGAPGGYAAQGTVYAEVDSANSISPTEREYSFDGSIQGYSVAHGTFNGAGDINYVAGAPRAKNLYGQNDIVPFGIDRYVSASAVGTLDRKVSVLFSQSEAELHVTDFDVNGLRVFIYKALSSRLKQVKKKTGEQIGSNFGHCVAASDLNGDGLDDLVIGAPSYWNREAQQVGVGQIYVYYQNKQFKLPDDTRTAITGKVANGRFGFAIAALGDINDDGVNDLAVGAPYDQNGAVFIYHGRRRGKINTEPTQVLRPESFEHPFQNFGFTLAGGRDADDNSYADLLVGDYSSDKVLLVRTKPIIRPTFEITFDREGVNITNSEITVLNQTIAGFEVRICMGYEGRGTPEVYKFSVHITMDAEKQTSRASFYDGEERRREEILPEVDIMKNDPWCQNFSVALRDAFPDKLTPIVVQVFGSPVENEDDLSPGEIAPVVDSTRQYSQGQIPIFVYCINERCTPDLVLTVESDQTTFYMGDTSSLTLTVTVENQADEAFVAKLYASVDASFKFASHNAIESELVIRCEDASLPGVVVCDIGNPLPRETRIKFNMSFDIPTVPGHIQTLSVDLHANSTTSEEDHVQHDNHHVVNLNLEPKINVILYSATNLPQLVYNDTTIDQKKFTSTTEAGEEIIHTYWIDNQGPGTIQNATLEVNWPMKTAEGEYLLYLTDVSLSSGEACYVTGTEINPLNLKIPKPATDEDRTRANNTIDINEASRRKRSVKPTDDDVEAELPSPLAQSYTDYINLANCSRGYKGCVKITCNITDVPKGSENVLTIRSRLWSPTLPKDNIESWDIVSSAVLTIHRLPYVSQPDEGLKKTAMLSLSAIPETLKENQTAPPWSIIISILIGLLLLLLIILILWRVGFFKRKKFDKSIIQGDQNEEELEEVKEGE